MGRLLRPVLVWLVFILAESVLGALRRGLASPELELAARQVGVGLGSLLAFALAWASVRWMGVRRLRQALAVGLAWTALTVAFEIGLGRLLGAPWSALARDYDLSRGGLMPLGLLALTVAPGLALALRRDTLPPEAR